MTRRARAAVMAGVLAIAGCAGSPTVPEASAPAIESVTVDGVSLSLALSRATTNAGEAIEAIVTVRNGSGRTIRWRSGGCDLRGSVTVRPADPELADDLGDEDGRLAAFIDAVAIAADEPTAPVTIGIDAAPDGRACQIDHGFAELTPGMHVSERALWQATARSGAPILPGPYLVTASFPMFDTATPLVPAEYEAARHLRPVSTEREILVEGSSDGRLTASQALRIFATDTDLGILVRRGVVGPADAMLTLDAGAWALRVRLATGGVVEGRLAADGRGSPTFGPAP